MTDIYNFFYRINDPEHIGNVGDGDDLCAACYKGRKIIDFQVALIINTQHLQSRFLPLAKHLPRDDVGMMLFFRNDNLVSLPHENFTERKSYKINGSCCA